MKFTKIQEKDNSNIIECNELDNDILFRKYPVKESAKILLKENQFLFLTEKGNILDFEEEPGIYLIEDGITEKEEFFENWKNIIISKSEDIPLSIVFLNRRIIKHNKYFIDNPIKYKEYSGEEEKEYYIKISGSFDFFIEDPKRFLEKIIGLRNHFSKQELIERIRMYVLESIEIGMQELWEEYKIDIETLQKESKELKIKLSQNASDQKLLEYGVKLNYFDIDNLEIIEDKKHKFFKKT